MPGPREGVAGLDRATRIAHEGDRVTRMGRGKLRVRTEPTLREIADAYLADLALRVAPKTVAESRAALERIQRETGWQALVDVTSQGLNGWRAARIAGGVSNRTVNRQVGELKAALALAVRDRILDHSPLEAVTALPTKGRHCKRKSRHLPDSDIGKLLAAAASIDAEKPAQFPRAPLLATLFDTGARWHELVQTTWADLDEAKAVLRFRAETTKTGKERRIPLRRRAVDRLLALRAAHTRVTGRFPTAQSRIFLAPKGGAWKQDTNRFHVFLREAMRRARIDHTDDDGRVFHIHACRPARRS